MDALCFLVLKAWGGLCKLKAGTDQAARNQHGAGWMCAGSGERSCAAFPVARCQAGQGERASAGKRFLERAGTNRALAQSCRLAAGLMDRYVLPAERDCVALRSRRGSFASSRCGRRGCALLLLVCRGHHRAQYDAHPVLQKPHAGDDLAPRAIHDLRTSREHLCARPQSKPPSVLPAHQAPPPPHQPDPLPP